MKGYICYGKFLESQFLKKIMHQLDDYIYKAYDNKSGSFLAQVVCAKTTFKSSYVR